MVLATASATFWATEAAGALGITTGVPDRAGTVVVGAGTVVAVVVEVVGAGAWVVVTIGGAAVVVVAAAVVVGAKVVVVVDSVVVVTAAAVVWKAFVVREPHDPYPTAAFEAFTAALYWVLAVRPVTVHEVAPVVVHVNNGAEFVSEASPAHTPAV